MSPDEDGNVEVPSGEPDTYLVTASVSGDTLTITDNGGSETKFKGGAPDDYDTVRTNASTGASHAAIADGNNPHKTTFANVQGKPTTLGGYGITDAQTKLVSGENIKTINSTSILGSGNIEVKGVTDYDDLDNKPKIGGKTLEGDKSLAELGITKEALGLGNVDNTADKDKPVSTAVQTALDGKQDQLVFKNGTFSDWNFTPGEATVFLFGDSVGESGPDDRYATDVSVTNEKVEWNVDGFWDYSADVSFVDPYDGKTYVTSAQQVNAESDKNATIIDVGGLDVAGYTSGYYTPGPITRQEYTSPISSVIVDKTAVKNSVNLVTSVGTRRRK